MPKVTNIQDVVENHLCCGCGICAYINPYNIRIVDDLENGRRPVVIENDDGSLNSSLMEEAFRVCPGATISYKNQIQHDNNIIHELLREWGPVRDVLEGYACDPLIRHNGSSGGVTTALALFGIEFCEMHGVLHIAARTDIPYLNHTVLSTSRDQIVARVGSRYAPASPCDGLQKIVDAPTPCVIIGKPCDIVAIEKARKIRPELDEKIGLTISIFCAATPSTAGTFAVMEHLGINDRDSVYHIQYRGNGWPGNACVKFNDDGKLHVKQMSYADSWGKILCHYRQWRCNLCVDHTGEFADISIGDPWYHDVGMGDPGRSLVLVRTRLGQQILRGAVNKGYLKLEKATYEILPASQPSLLNIRRSVWGRLLALRLVGVATPKIHDGIPLFRLWLTHLSFRQKLQSIIGTVKRVLRYKLWKRRKVNPFV